MKSMTTIIRQIPAVAAASMVLLSKATGLATPGFRAFALLPAGAVVTAVLLLSSRGNASPIHKGMAVNVQETASQ